MPGTAPKEPNRSDQRQRSVDIAALGERLGEVVPPRRGPELEHILVEDVLAQVVHRRKGPLAVEPAVGQHPERQHDQNARNHPGIELPAAVEHQQPDAVAQQRKPHLEPHRESQSRGHAQQHAPAELPPAHGPMTAHRERRQQQEQVARDHLGVEMDVEVGQVPKEKSQQQEPAAGILVAQVIAHRAVEEQQRGGRKGSAQQLEHEDHGERRIDPRGQQSFPDGPRHERLYAGAHLQEVLPRQMIRRRGPEELHMGVFEYLEMFVGMVGAQAESGV